MSLHFRIRVFSATILISFLCPEIATSINTQVPLLLSLIMLSGVLSGLVVSVYTFCFHNVVTYIHDSFRFILVLRNNIVHCLILLPFTYIFIIIIIIIIIIIVHRRSFYHQHCLLRYVALKRWIHRIIPQT